MRSKRLLSSTICALLFAGILALSATPANALSSSESDFAASHNNIRSSRGKSTLVVKDDLVAVARRHSGRMASAEDIWHNPSLGSDVSGWQVVGENVGMGGSVDELMDAFMNSPAHRSNILDSDYNQFGVGVVVNNGTIYVTVVFAKRATASVRTPTTTTTRPRSTTTTTRRRAIAAQPTPAARPAAKAAAPASTPAPTNPKGYHVQTVWMLMRMNGMSS